VTGRHPRGADGVAVTTAVTPLQAAELHEATRLWWLKLVTGACWLLLSVIVFRFDWTTVSAISILFGIVMLGAAATETINVFTSQGWWRVGYGLLAVTFVVIGIVAFIHPGGTFAALAGVMSFYFIFKGGMTIATSIGMFRGTYFQWVPLLIGIAEVLLGFWAAGYFGHRTILLVVWVGAIALTRAITDVFEAFAIRRLRDA
jgi:uncharacterized membrane protein HdeD (DUF308 family)